MIIIKSKELKSHGGKYICIYSLAGVGKTVTTLATCIDPLLWLTIEPRAFEDSIEAADRPKLRYELAIYQDFIDLLDFISKPESFEKYRTIFFDGASYLSNIVLPGEIQQEEYRAMDDAARKKHQKKILSMTKVTQPQTGQRNQAMFRILSLLGTNAVARGKIVIISCLEQERPKYDRELTAGPALGGKEVPDNWPAFFDFIGRLTPNVVIDEEGEEVIKYPPIISFESNGGFLAKYTGKGGEKECPLHWGKILGGIDGKKGGIK